MESVCSSVESITCYDLQAYLGLVNCILNMTTYEQKYAEIKGIYIRMYVYIHIICIYRYIYKVLFK